MFKRAAAMLALLAAPAAAAEPAPAGGWQFNLVPYVWAAGIDGTLAHNRFPLDVEVEASFGDILRRLDIGGMMAFEGRRGDWGFIGDVITVRLSDDEAARIPRLGIPIGMRSNTTSVMLGGQYRLVDSRRSASI